MLRSDQIFKFINFILILFLAVFIHGSGFAASFSANMVETHGAEIESGKIFVHDHLYRMETTRHGKELYIIVDTKLGKTRILLPCEKVYIEMDNTSMRSLMKNPFEAYRYTKSKYKVFSSSKDSYQGLNCEKQKIFINNKKAIIALIAKKYDFPVKIVEPENMRKLELDSIMEKSINPLLFKVPENYKKVKRLPYPKPEWAEEILKAPVKKLPLDIRLAKGEIIVIKPLAGFSIYMKFKNITNNKSTAIFTSIPFKNNKPILDPALSTIKLSPGGNQKKMYSQSPSKIDFIAIYVKKGLIHCTIDKKENIDVEEYLLKTNQGRKISLNEKKPSRFILSDDRQDNNETICKIKFYTRTSKKVDDGTTLFEDKEIIHESVKLENGQSKTWIFPADKNISSFNVRVLKGAVIMRSEQPKTLGEMPVSWKASQDVPQASISIPHSKPESSENKSSKTSSIQSMVLILDSSGSMWGKVKGEPKIKIAKSVLKDLIKNMPGNINTGIMTYGHRRKGDCNDIEMILPIGKLDPETAIDRINAISPKGKTPLSAAVDQAAKALEYATQRASIILISDGLETCEGNPCRLAEKLAMAGFNFTIHVIGFDLTESEQAQLKCLAEKTGGLFLAANDAAGLRKSLFYTVEKLKQPPPPEQENLGEAQLDAPETISAGSVFKIKWQGPASLKDYISIAVKTAKDPDYVDYVFIKTGNPVQMMAPGKPGEYELRYVCGHSKKVIGRKDIIVTKVEAKIIIPPNVVMGAKFSVKWQGPAYKGDYITIAKSDQDTTSYFGFANISQGNPVFLTAPADPGTYEVRYVLGHGTELLTKTTIIVKPAEASVNAPATVPAGTRFKVKWQGPGEGKDMIMIATPDQKATSFVGIAYIYQGNPVIIKAPDKPGTYEVRYILFQGAKLLAKTTIAVTAP